MSEQELQLLAELCHKFVGHAIEEMAIFMDAGAVASQAAHTMANATLAARSIKIRREMREREESRRQDAK